jgi:hypothetical protein
LSMPSSVPGSVAIWSQVKTRGTDHIPRLRCHKHGRTRTICLVVWHLKGRSIDPEVAKSHRLRHADGGATPSRSCRVGRCGGFDDAVQRRAADGAGEADTSDEPQTRLTAALSRSPVPPDLSGIELSPAICPLGSGDALRTLSLPDDVAGKMKTQVFGIARVDNVVLDLVRCDRSITYAAYVPPPVRGFDQSDHSDGQAPIRHAFLCAQAKLTLW